MAFNLDQNGSSERLITHGSGRSTAGTSTPTGYDSPVMSGPGRPKKNVKWSLGQDSTADPSPEGTPHATPTAEDIGTTADPNASSIQHHDAREHAELRDQLEHILRHPSGSKEHLGIASTTPQQPITAAKLPKSVLRSGTSTPAINISPPPETADDVTGEKGASASRAKYNAEQLSKTLADEGDDYFGHHARSSWRNVLAKKHGRRGSSSERRSSSLYFDNADHLESGQVTPDSVDGDYVPRPNRVRAIGFTASNWYDKVSHFAHSRRNSEESEPPSPAGLAPHRPRWLHSPRHSISSLSGLVQSGSALGSIGSDNASRRLSEATKAQRPQFNRAGSDTQVPRRNSSSNLLSGLDTLYQKAKAVENKKRKKSSKQDIKIKLHVKETFLRQRYLRRLCRAFMEYGAPTHRLESYMRNSSRVLDIDSHWLYLPNCMIASFDDANTHTSEVKLIRASEGVDLGKLRDSHDVYKQVVHDEIGVDEALTRLDSISNRPKKFNTLVSVIAHGFASASVAPFAFKGRLIDLPIAFGLGILLGTLRLVVAKKSDLYSSIFEVASVIITSAIARGIGSINNNSLFCFSSLAQSAIALILPGYIVLCGALELQSRSLVAGSVRLVYAIIYSLFIGFGLTIGSAIVGWADKGASSESVCRDPMPDYWYFFFVPLFALCLMVINQAKYKQMPIMMFIALVGYFSSFVFAKYLPGNASVSSAIAAIAISILANIYSRVGDRLDKPFADAAHRIRAALTGNATGTALDEEEGQSSEKRQRRPSGHERIHSTSADSDTTLAAPSGSNTPEEPTSHRQDNKEDQSSPRNGMDGQSTDRPQTRVNYSPAAAVMLPAIFVLVPSGLSVSGSLVSGITSADSLVSNTTTAADPSAGTTSLANSTAFTVGLNVIQVAIGITVGLFVGTVFVYPFGKGGKWGGSKKTRTAAPFTY